MLVLKIAMRQFDNECNAEGRRVNTLVSTGVRAALQVHVRYCHNASLLLIREIIAIGRVRETAH